MTRIVVGVEYHGAGFHGWQIQQGLRTAEGELTQGLSQVADHAVKLVCAGRTDRGVHALAQVVHFDSDAIRPAHSWLLGANSYLDIDLAVKWVCPMDSQFHARFSAISRTYVYIIYNHRAKPACFRRQATWISYPLALEKMQQAAECLLGKHDFSAFRAKSCQAKTAVRTIEKLSIVRQGDLLLLEITANAFLHHMVRNIVGALLAVGAGKEPSSWVKHVLAGRNRASAGITAPPDGLYLRQVRYPSQFALPAFPQIHF